METIKRSSRISAAMLLFLAALGTGRQAYADYFVYHGVKTKEGTGLVEWSANSFGVSGAPPTLSFSHYEDDETAKREMSAFPCLLRVSLIGIDNPRPGSSAEIGAPSKRVNGLDRDLAKQFPWTIVFDNEPERHWSVPRAALTSMATNAAAGRVAADGFEWLAATPDTNVIVVDGSRTDCMASISNRSP